MICNFSFLPRATAPTLVDSMVGTVPFSTVTLQLAFLLLQAVAVTVATPGARATRVPAASTDTTPGLSLVQAMGE